MAAWLPSDAATALALWIDPADAATVTASGGAVSQITDKSGNGLTVVPRSTAPGQTTINGNSALSIQSLTSGSQQAMYNNSSGLDAITNSDNTLCCVSAWDGVTNSSLAHFAFGSEDSTGANRAYAWVRASVAPNGMSYRHGATTTTDSTAVGSSGDVSIATRSGTAINGYRNGTNVVTAANGASFTSATATFFIGGGYLPTPNVFLAFSGWIGDCLVYSGVLSQSDREKLEGYLAHKWGLQGSLPSNHPYKNSPPQRGLPPMARPLNLQPFLAR